MKRSLSVAQTARLSLPIRYRVSTVLERSVRKSGNRLRITAQLINAADGFQIWSGQYDRELSDLFAVQEQIHC